MAASKPFWRQCFRPRDSRPPWQWGAAVVTLKNSPLGKRFNPDLTPWLKEPLEVFPDNRIREITCQCCVQSGKTTIMQIAQAWAMEFQPAPMMINCQTDDDAKDFAQERFNPMIEAIPSIARRLPLDRSRKRTCAISLSDMFVLIQGANLSNLQSKSIRWLFNDELFLWKQGLIDHARKRTTQFWNRRIFNASTAGDVDGDLDLAFKAGDQREWHLACPLCGKLNNPKWERIKWPKNEATCPEGEWNFEELKAQTYFECEHCQGHIVHTDRNHKVMNAGGRYVAMNPRPTPGHVTFHWNALCLSPSVLSWGDLAVEWVKAQLEYEKGNAVPLKEFITKRLAESWNDNYSISYHKLPTIKIDNRWPDEAYRFQLVDVQEHEFWVMTQAWSLRGDSLVLWFGSVKTWADVAAKQREYGVHNRRVFVDCGYEDLKVFAECVRHGVFESGELVTWTALRGDPKRSFTYYSKKKKQAIQLPYSWPPDRGDPLTGQKGQGSGPSCPLIYWSNPTIKDIAKRRRDGLSGSVKAMIAEGVSDELSKHLYAEQRVREFDKRTGQEKIIWKRIGKRPNHGWDCFNMGIVAACLAKIIGEGEQVD